tara:strand:+ start:291 stop:728 length:438 start_codon:yes stop_codon:yes gene_type:complete
MSYVLENVTSNIELWFNKDPVRPELDADFKTEAGREVFGLKNESGEYKAFLCMARTDDVPTDTADLAASTSLTGEIAVPYSVWSYQRGAGREIINQALTLMRMSKSVKRVVTLSPLTDMARSFHLRNNAFELRVNDTTANFEYLL